MTRLVDYTGVNPRLRGIEILPTLTTKKVNTQVLPGVSWILSGAEPPLSLKREAVEQDAYSPLTPTSEHDGARRTSICQGLSMARTNCCDCGTLITTATNHPRCDQCQETFSETIHLRDVPFARRQYPSPAREDSMDRLHRILDGRVSKLSVPDIRPSDGESFWSPRVGTPSDDNHSPDPGRPIGVSQVRSTQKRVGKAKREQESRSKQGEKLKQLEDFVLANDAHRSKLQGTSELNSNNAQKSGLTFKKEDVMESAFQTLVYLQNEIILFKEGADMLKDFLHKVKIRIPHHVLEHCELLKDLNELQTWALHKSKL